MTAAETIFRPLRFRNLEVPNRIFRANVAGRFDNYDGSGTQTRINWELKFARGGVGAILSSWTAVDERGKIVPSFAGIERDERIPFWRELAERVHEHDCRFILQLAHAGRQRDVPTLRHRKGLSSTDKPDPLHGFEAERATKNDIEAIKRSFAAGARRARAAGLDGVEVHGANGYVFTQFLSSAINDRTDEYGGPLENRARLLLETVRAIRAEVGHDFHVQVKVSTTEHGKAFLPWIGAGNTIEDSVQVCRWLEEAGADAIHVSSGNTFPHPENPAGEFSIEDMVRTYDAMLSSGVHTFRNYLMFRTWPVNRVMKRRWERDPTTVEGRCLPDAEAVKKAVAIPVIVTGDTATTHGITSFLPLPKAERKGVALCLSGGGYRAALFHLGALRRLNELGLLSRIDTFTAVSGGSIALAQLATFMARRDGPAEPGRPIEGFEQGVVAPLREFTGKDVRTGAALARLHPRKWLSPGAQSEALAASYEQGPAPGRLADLPEKPRFVFLASDMRFRDQWVFDTGLRRVGSTSAGFGAPGDWTLAQAVAASSCVPGAFGAATAKQEPSALRDGTYAEADRDELVGKIDLSDGGIYDNLGVEPVWRDHSVVLVSDAAPSFKPEPNVGWLWSALRYGVTFLEQATEVRKRWLVAEFIRGDLEGAYWGIASRPASYEHDPPPPPYSERLIRDFIAPIRIDLDVFSPGEIGVLENHGYLMAEVSIRRHARALVDGEWPEATVPHPRWMDEAAAEQALRSSGKTRIFFRPRFNP